MFLHLFHQYFCMWLNYQSASLCIDTILKYDKCSAVAEMGDRLATIDVGRKVGGLCLFLEGSWVPI